MGFDPTTAMTNAYPYLTDIAAGIATAARNLNEIQPGFPANTPGSGSVGSGSGGISDRVGNRAVDQVENGIEDVAQRDLARLNELMGQIIPNHRALREMRNLVVRWNYLTPGTVDPGLLARTAAATETKTNEERWCRSCLRLQHCNPVYRTHRIDDEQTPLCTWCYRFVLAEGIVPPAAILEAHQHGHRISEAQVKAALREYRKANPAKVKPKTGKRKK